MVVHVSDRIRRLAYPLGSGRRPSGASLTFPPASRPTSLPRRAYGSYWLFGAMAEAAAVVHDFLYSTEACLRKQADEVFAEACKAKRLAAWRRGAMWMGIRLFGAGRYAAAG